MLNKHVQTEWALQHVLLATSCNVAIHSKQTISTFFKQENEQTRQCCHLIMSFSNHQCLTGKWCQQYQIIHSQPTILHIISSRVALHQVETLFPYGERHTCVSLQQLVCCAQLGFYTLLLRSASQLELELELCSLVTIFIANQITQKKPLRYVNSIDFKNKCVGFLPALM